MVARPCWFDSSPGHHPFLAFPQYLRAATRFPENHAEGTGDTPGTTGTLAVTWKHGPRRTLPRIAPMLCGATLSAISHFLASVGCLIFRISQISRTFHPPFAHGNALFGVGSKAGLRLWNRKQWPVFPLGWQASESRDSSPPTVLGIGTFGISESVVHQPGITPFDVEPMLPEDRSSLRARRGYGPPFFRGKGISNQKTIECLAFSISLLQGLRSDN